MKHLWNIAIAKLLKHGFHERYTQDGKSETELWMEAVNDWLRDRRFLFTPEGQVAIDYLLKETSTNVAKQSLPDESEVSTPETPIKSPSSEPELDNGATTQRYSPGDKVARDKSSFPNKQSEEKL